MNKRFEEEVRRLVGDARHLKLKTASGYRSALNDFDGHLKSGFRGPSDPDRYVSFPMAGLKNNKAAGLVGNSMTLTG